MRTEEKAKVDALDDENRRITSKRMEGRRAALPEGTFREPVTGPQSDQNRDQPVGPDGKLTVPLPGPEVP